jgi:hypothetical protein
MAVGQGPAGAALAELWDGTSWAPASPTGTDTEFDGVSCTSAEDCTAVGAAGQSVLAEHWDGLGWTLETTVDEPGANSSLLESVSCTSGSDCTAVGRGEFPFTPPDTPRFVPLAEHWDGSTWTLQSTPNPSLSGDLTAVSCPASGSCTAAGYSAGDVVPLVENWNGTSWTVANGPPGTGSFLLGISCTSPGACSAVGAGDAAVGPSGKVIRNEGVALAAALAGAEWTVKPAQDDAAPSTATVAGVSCSAGSACTAVGSYSSHSGDIALTERWDGTTWTTQPPAPETSGQVMLEGVACPSSTRRPACAARLPIATPTRRHPLRARRRRQRSGTQARC